MKRLFFAAILAVTAMTSWAGGLLTNTNQNVTFLRNPAQDGAININGVYSNPAGVAFLGDGLHLGLNVQSAFQSRIIDTTNPLFALGYKNNGATMKTFEGKASAPVIPSLQAAYNTGKWSFQFNFAIHGGGGKCTFDNGIGSFEGAIPAIASMINTKTAPLAAMGVPLPTVNGYDADIYMQGKQYYFGFTLGSAYKVTDNLSVYGGLRVLYGNATYNAKLENIRLMDINSASSQKAYSLNEYFNATGEAITNTAIALAKAGQAEKAQALQAAGQQLAAEAETYAIFSDGVKLLCDQSAVGFAPIIGVDYKIGNFNFAGKYEFRAKMSLENKSDLRQAVLDKAPAMMADKLQKFVDGGTVREDNPASLALGAQWTALPNLRVNAGYHHFYDCEAKRYGDEQKKLDGGTNEYLGGVEYDINDKFTVSGGVQVTKYGLTDDFMNDMSFVVDSWSFGLGAKYQVSDKVAINAAYFKTNYSDYKTAAVQGVTNNFTRKNDVVGVGVELNF